MRAFIKSVPLALFVAVSFVACSDDKEDSAPATGTEVGGTLKEFTIELDSSTAAAGEVTFTVANEGTVPHEFLVVKTDIAAGEIPLDGDHFAEPADGIEVIDKIGEFAIGTTETLTLTLDAGKYQIVCNLPGHYAQGMFTAFTVE